MKLTTNETALLEALTHGPGENGEYQSIDEICQAFPNDSKVDVRQAARTLAEKRMVKLDDDGCVTITEMGVAAIKSM